MAKLREFCLKFIAVVGALIFLFLTYYAWRYTMRMFSSSEDLFVEKDSILLSLVFTAAFTGICAIAGRLAEKAKARTLEIIAALLSLAVMLLLFYIISIPDTFYFVGDQANVYLAAESIYNGTINEYADYTYFRLFPYQIQVGSVFALLFMMARTASMQVIEYAHAVFLSLSIFAGFHITKEIFRSEKVLAVYLLSMTTFAPMYFFVFFVYGETLGTSFTVFSICFFLKAVRPASKRTASVILWILCALALLVACMMRPTMLIAGIAMLIERILFFMNTKKVIQPVLSAAVIGVYLVGRVVLFLPLQAETGIGLNDGAPPILNIAMGLQDGDPKVNTGKGSYNGYNWVVFAEESNFSTQQASQIGVSYLQERISHFISHPGEMASFFKEKALNQWTEPSYGAFTMTRYLSAPPEWLSQLYHGTLNAQVYGFMNLWQSCAYLFLFLGFVFLIKKRECPGAFVPALILIGGFLLTLIWESKSRYAYPYVVFAVPLISGSVAFTLEKITAISRRIRRYTRSGA